MNLIKQIFNKEVDEETHQQFVRYGLGRYEPRASVIINNSPIMKIYASFEYATFLTGFFAENLKGKVEVTGSIFSKTELPDSVKKKQFFMVEFDGSLSVDELKQTIEERKKDSYILLSILPQLKIKNKLPNPRGKFDEKFCTVAIKDEDLKKKILKELAFDIEGEFKKAEIRHSFVIEEIEVPKEYSDDPAQARIHSKRKGMIERNLIVDGKETKNTTQFSA